MAVTASWCRSGLRVDDVADRRITAAHIRWMLLRAPDLCFHSPTYYGYT